MFIHSILDNQGTAEVFQHCLDIWRLMYKSNVRKMLIYKFYNCGWSMNYSIRKQHSVKKTYIFSFSLWTDALIWFECRHRASNRRTHIMVRCSTGLSCWCCFWRHRRQANEKYNVLLRTRRNRPSKRSARKWSYAHMHSTQYRIQRNWSCKLFSVVHERRLHSHSLFSFTRQFGNIRSDSHWSYE